MPRCILQVDLQNRKLADEQRNIVKVAILEGDSIIEDSIAIIIYDYKPVIFFQVQFQRLCGIQLLREYSVKIWTRKCRYYFLDQILLMSTTTT